MPRIKYSIEMDSEDSARARAYELDISPKHAYELCRELRGMRIVDARKYLEEVINMKRAVPFKRHNRDVGHRKKIKGWDAGRYPQKAAKALLKLIQNVESNAEYKGLEAERLRIMHLASHKGQTTRGFMPRAMGRASPNDDETVNIEIIISET